MPSLRRRKEAPWAFGRRPVGTVWAVGEGEAVACGKLPMRLSTCPWCGSGPRSSAEWQWISAGSLTSLGKCSQANPFCPGECPLAAPLGRVGLIWLDEQVYPTPVDWAVDVLRHQLAVYSTRPSIMGELEVGGWVLVAHSKGIEDPDGSYSPAVIASWQITSLELIVERGLPEDEDYGYDQTILEEP